MSQPNDITVARDGTIYASDPNWKGREGHVWRIAKAADGSVQGQVMTAAARDGDTNGIDLSPDGKTLYVGESSSGQVWSYTISGNALTDAKLVKAFQPDTIDGLRADVSGRLYVARILKGMIALIKPNGTVEREIVLKGKEPTNSRSAAATARPSRHAAARAASSSPFAPTSRARALPSARPLLSASRAVCGILLACICRRRDLDICGHCQRACDTECLSEAVHTELHRSHDPQFFLVRGVVKRTTEQPERADRLLKGLKDGKHQLVERPNSGRARVHAFTARNICRS